MASAKAVRTRRPRWRQQGRNHISRELALANEAAPPNVCQITMSARWYVIRTGPAVRSKVSRQ